MDNQPAPEPTAPTQPVADAAPAVLPPIPATWPSAFGLYKYSRDTVRFNFLTLVLLVVGYIASAIVVSIVLSVVKAPYALSQLISNLVGIVFSVALMVTLLASMRRVKHSVGESIKHVWPVYLKAVLLDIALTIISLVSLLLLIVPYFIIMPRLILSFYFLIDKQMGVQESLKASWDHTKGNVGKVWGIIGASLAMALLFITIIGIPFAIYFLIMYSGAWVLLYGYLTSQAPAAAAPVAEQPASPAPPAETPAVQ